MEMDSEDDKLNYESRHVILKPVKISMGEKICLNEKIQSRHSVYNTEKTLTRSFYIDLVLCNTIDHETSNNNDYKLAMRDAFEEKLRLNDVKIQHYNSLDIQFTKLNAPFYILLDEADKLKLDMPMKNCEEFDSDTTILHKIEKYFITDNEVDYTSGLFSKAYFGIYKNCENRNKFFRPALRSLLFIQYLDSLDIKLCTNKINHPDEDDDDRKGLSYFLNKKIYNDKLLLHEYSNIDPHEIELYKTLEKGPDEKFLRKLDTKEQHLDERHLLNQYWCKTWFKFQPLWRIRNYFGEKIALYFSWVGLLGFSLIGPAIFGLIIFIIGLNDSIANYQNFPQNVTQTDNSTLSDACTDISCTVNLILDISLKACDSQMSLPYAVIICIWGTLFIEFWKRKNATLAYQWDVRHYEMNEVNRPEYHGTNITLNPVTNEATKYTPFKIQCSKYLASVMVLLFMICILFIITANIIVYRIFTNIRYCSDISKLSCLFVSNIVSSLANTIAIVAFGAVYNILAVKLTDWENHQTETNYNNALIIKLFSFHFINSYTTPFYIAFFRNIKFENGVFGLGGEYQDTCDKECMQMLTIQIFFLMIGKAFPKFFTDVVLPVLKRIKQRGFFNKVVRVALDKSIYMEREYIKPQLTDFTLSEYNEKIILYGFVMIFAASIPIGPLIALIVIYADIKVDASRLLWIYRRPVADISQNIGIWQGILELLNVIGVISNAFLIAYTSKFGKDYLNSTERKMIFVVIFEHALFTIKFLAAYAIPDVPKQIAIAIRRANFRFCKIIEQYKEQ